MKRVPLAWNIVTHDRKRLALSLCGVAFSVLIMFMEMGFYNGLNDSQARIPALLNADLVLLHSKRDNLLESDRFERLRLSMGRAFPQVQETVPFYEGFTAMRNPQTRQVRKIYVLAFPPGSAPLRVKGAMHLEEKLKKKGSVVFDRLSRDIYGRIDAGTEVELESGMRHRVVGTVEIGPNFGHDGYLLMGAGTWRELGNSDRVSLGLVRLHPGNDPAALRDSLASRLPRDVLVLTPEALRLREVEFTANATPSGVIFGTGLFIGLIIGAVICYQILFNTIADHIAQFATLRAMGFDDSYLIGVVMRKALLLSVLGFVPGLLASLGLYGAIEHYTSIIMSLDASRIGAVWLLTVFMCCLAGALAMRKALRADPAELY